MSADPLCSLARGAVILLSCPSVLVPSLFLTHSPPSLVAARAGCFNMSNCSYLQTQQWPRARRGMPDCCMQGVLLRGASRATTLCPGAVLHETFSVLMRHAVPAGREHARRTRVHSSMCCAVRCAPQLLLHCHGEAECRRARGLLQHSQGFWLHSGEHLLHIGCSNMCPKSLVQCCCYTAMEKRAASVLDAFFSRANDFGFTVVRRLPLLLLLV